MENQTRYFYYTAMGKAPNGNLNLNNMGLQTDGNYPTMRELIESHNKSHQDLREVIIVGLTEMSHDDWFQFISEQ
jgi:hypothetical protein